MISFGTFPFQSIFNPFSSLFHPSGSVICDACSLAAEGETDIQEDFCQSPYGEKKNVGSQKASFFLLTKEQSRTNLYINVNQATDMLSNHAYKAVVLQCV